MSDIQRYMYARDGMVPDAEHLRGSGEPEFWVRFTDHEAERAENLATIDFLNKELRSAVDALADAEARIEGLVHKEQGFDNADMEYGYGRGLAESIRALAALTQPQTDEDARIEREIAELERRADKLKKRYHGDLEARCESLAEKFGFDITEPRHQLHAVAELRFLRGAHLTSSLGAAFAAWGPVAVRRWRMSRRSSHSSA